MSARLFFSLMALALAAYVVLLAGTARASCLSIRGFDKRQACLAEERRSPEGCVSIRNPDERALCQVRAGRRDPMDDDNETRLAASRTRPLRAPD
jgi:hypothetical protein